MILLLIVLLISVETISGQFKTSCPLKETIAPCSCSIDKSRQPWITCSGLNSLQELQKAMKYLKGYSYSSFFIENSNLGSLPSDLFTDMEIQSLKIILSNLTRIGDGVNRPPFTGLENSLQDLEIKEAFIDSSSPMTSFSLAHLKKLNILEINSNIIPSISNDWFESGPYGLKQLLFITTSTKKLGSHVFASLVNAKQISVTVGSISTLSRSMFPSTAPHLTTIDLSDQALSSLPEDIFHRMPSLTEVYLDDNGFTTINEMIFSTVWNQLTHIYFYGNPMDCDEGIKWVYKYRLPEVLGGSCVTPPNLKQKELRKLTLRDFQ